MYAREFVLVWVDHGYDSWDKCTYTQGSKVNSGDNENINIDENNNYTNYFNSKADDLMDIIL